MSVKTIISTDSAPKAIGPYSQAVGYNGLVFLSGQIGLDPHTGELAPGGVESQTSRVMQNLEAVLDAAGLGFEHVLKATIYLKNMTDFTIVNEIYGAYFDDAPPARGTVEVSRLPKDVLVEIEMIAAAPTDEGGEEEDEPVVPEVEAEEPEEGVVAEESTTESEPAEEAESAEAAETAKEDGGEW